MASRQCSEMIDGIGQAGAKATWQLAETGLKVRLTEMRSRAGWGPLKAISLHTVHSGTCSLQRWRPAGPRDTEAICNHTLVLRQPLELNDWLAW